jgi:PHP family Zn ribbon phosphoesterase
MEVSIDLHIHSALSPCSDDDMTPNNIVNMAILNGLQAIAVTDHNSCDNVEAVMKAAKGRLVVVPGVELQTREEVHLLAYFKDLSSLYDFQTKMEKFHDGIPNDPLFFGHQLIMNEFDEIIGEKQQLLLTSLSLSFEDTVNLIRTHGGLPVPAHINKPSYSVLSQLGFIPPNLSLTLLEFSHNFTFNFDNYPNSKFLTSSDAHSLGQIQESKTTISVEDLTENDVYGYLYQCFI